MTEPIEYEPPDDPLYRDMHLRHQAAIPVLGIPVRYASNAPAVIEQVEAAFGAWRVLETTPELVEAGAREVAVNIVVHPGDEGPGEHAGIYHRALGEQRLLFGSRGSIGYADPGRREAFGFVTPELVADRQHFRYMMLEALTLCAVTPHDRQPFHAAAVVRGDTGVVLAGPSGAGKSSIAYAAARAGLPVLGEDTVYLQSRPVLRVWGLPGYLHLPPETRRWFPELEARTPTLMANGEEKLAIDLRAMDALPRLPVVERAVLCIVGRGEAEPGLQPIEPDEAVSHLMARIEHGFDLFEATIAEPLAALAAPQAWRLSVPNGPAEAVPWIERLLDEVEGG